MLFRSWRQGKIRPIVFGYGEGRAIPWPSLTERFHVSGAVVASSDVHRGVGLCAGLEASDSPETGDGQFKAMAATALDEFARKDFVYVYAGLSDEVVHGTDVNATVRGIESFDRDLVGPILDGLAKKGPYRFLVLCDHGEGNQGQAFSVFGEGTGDRKSTRLNSSHSQQSRMPSSA